MYYCKPEQLFDSLKSGDNVFVHTAVCNPTFLLHQLVEVPLAF